MGIDTHIADIPQQTRDALLAQLSSQRKSAQNRGTMGVIKLLTSSPAGEPLTQVSESAETPAPIPAKLRPPPFQYSAYLEWRDKGGDPDEQINKGFDVSGYEEKYQGLLAHRVHRSHARFKSRKRSHY